MGFISGSAGQGNDTSKPLDLNPNRIFNSVWEAILVGTILDARAKRGQSQPTQAPVAPTSSEAVPQQETDGDNALPQSGRRVTRRSPGQTLLTLNANEEKESILGG